MTTIPSWQSLTLLALLLLGTRFLARLLWQQRPALQPAGAALCFAPDRRNMAALLGLLALLIIALIVALLLGDTIDTVDARIRDAVRVLHSDAFVWLFLAITTLGDSKVLAAVTLSTAASLWFASCRLTAARLALSALGSAATVYAMKYSISRARPEFEHFASASSPSFPSSHSSGAVAVYGFILCLVIHQFPQQSRMRFEIAFWGMALILMLCASRIILGVHFASDVLAGFMIGSFWLLTSHAVSRD
ncbi:MAG TPA: phosphatase PAP2 family protein [Salinisphaeraceae bacterium]|nr:phosphatase PAP2 family protein [Salinisphaeraceae bacterium]